MIQTSDNLQINSFEPVESTAQLGANRPTKTRIRIRIPKTFHEDPVISRLVSHHGVTVNITAALLGANARDDGWFDLELRGTASPDPERLNLLK